MGIPLFLTIIVYSIVIKVATDDLYQHDRTRHRWQEVTGQNKMDATAILDYFAPLKTWLDQQNQGQKCGW